MEGLPFDPVLAVYARLGFAAFATDVAGIALHPLSEHDRQLEEQNRWWQQSYQQHLPLPTFVFAGEPHLAYHYATVPSLAHAQGRQPVIWVDVHEEPYAIPVASDADQLFAAYSHYLDALRSLPDGKEEGAALLAFPLGSANIISRDTRLMECFRSGLLAPFTHSAEQQEWAHNLMTTSTELRK
ncbi:hypothetical protein [Hyalangium rubrum]|uniref:Uncharacterized protein n=1 Tax=Hyalangium rubrum TaxID=3103134 RepID=A0ABU5H3E4_9BACT|nr:hypothetical protein [Hyalangium sp. s54d21]MDY7227991.1 hypothetical protein [Hyalangium sp. s54d21]